MPKSPNAPKAAASGKAKPKPLPEFFRMGRRGYTVTPYVREDRGLRIYFRWPAKGPGGGYEKLASDLVWPVGAETQKRFKAEAEARALRISDARRLGLPAASLERIAVGGDVGPGANVDPHAHVTVADIMREAIGPSPRGIPTTGPGSWTARTAFWRDTKPAPRGIYKSWTQEARQARREADRIEDVWGARTDYFSLTANDLHALWTEGVADNAERRVRLALQLSLWASRKYAARGYEPVLPTRRDWKQEIKERTGGSKPADVHDRRYTAEEAGALWQAVWNNNSLVDWHVRLAVRIGGEARLGQVILSTLDDVQDVYGAGLFLTPPQSGKKMTGAIPISARCFEAFKHAMDLARATPDRRLFPVSRHKLGLGFRQLEEAARITPRGPYALRRAMIDMAPIALAALSQDPEGNLAVVDPVVLEAISHHRPTGVRDTIYRRTPVGYRGRLMQGTPLMSILLAAESVREHARRMAAIRAASAAEPTNTMEIAVTDWPQTEPIDYRTAILQESMALPNSL